LENNWFDTKGYNGSGYRQIRARIEYMEKEGVTDYEMRVTRRLLNQIPNDITRKIYERMLEDIQ